MATTAPITGMTARAPAFVLNGTTPLTDNEPWEYIHAAHAVVTTISVMANDVEGGEKFACADSLLAGALDAVSLLLAHGAKLLERVN